MSSNKIDEIVNDAYKYFFNPSKKDFKTKSVLIKEVLNDNELFKYDRTNEFKNELSDYLFNDEVILISANSDKIMLSRKNEENDNKSLINIFFYKNTENADNINSEININSINRFILYTNSGKLSFVTLPIINFDLELNLVKDKLEKFEEVSKILKKNKSSLISVQITGNFHKIKDLKEELKEISNEDFSIMLFELVYGLFHHQRKYPELRLNFESLDSFLLYSKNPSDKLFNYFVNDNHYQVKDIGLKLKFHDLRNSIIHNDLDNNSLSKKQKKISQSDDLINLIDLFKVVSKDNKKMIDSIINEIKKEKLNAEKLLLSNSIFSKFKQSKPNVESSEMNDEVDSGVDFINPALDTSSVGGYSNIDNISTNFSHLSFEGGKSHELKDDSDESSDEDSDVNEVEVVKKKIKNDDSDSDSIDLDVNEDGDGDEEDGDENEDEEDENEDEDEDEDEEDIKRKKNKVSKIMSKKKEEEETETSDLASLDTASSVDYSNDNSFRSQNIKIKKNEISGNRKLHSGLTDNSDSSLISLSFSDSLSRNRKVKKKVKKENLENKTNRLGNLLGAKNVKKPNGMHDFMPKNSVSNFYKQNEVQNDGYNVYSPASIPDVNEGLEETMNNIKNMNKLNNNLGQFNDQINNVNSNLPPYVQKELNNLNFKNKMPLNSLQLNENLQMNNSQGLPMNNVQQFPMDNMQGLSMNNMNLPMNNMNLPMNNMNLPMNNMNLPMNNMQGFPMNNMQGFQSNGIQNGLNQNQINEVLKKYGPNYNGPIDMIGGGKSDLVDLKFMLNDNLSSGQKKKTKSNKNERGNQVGGFERIIPEYEGTKNSPFKTQETKKIEATRFNEIPNYLKDDSKDDPLVEFKVNPSVLGVQKPVNQSIIPAKYIPIQNKVIPSNFPYVSGAHNMLPYSFVPNNVPVINNYRISMPNPAGDHIKLADLYEDMLPQNDNNYKNTSLTLEERLITYNYVRSILVRIGDGEDIEISGKIGTSTNRKNLLSYLKLLDLNPYHNSKISQNPYSSLPEKMLMYRSCYPIRFDASKNSVTCSKYSIGLNLRIYEMSIAEFEVKKMFYNDGKDNKDIKKSRFNLWREIAFYEFVREEILKKKICPHFCMMYSWFISTGSDVDFRKLRLIKNQYGKEISKADLNMSIKITNEYKDALKKYLENQLKRELNTIDNPNLRNNSSPPQLEKYLNKTYVDSYGVRRNSKYELGDIHDKPINIFDDRKDRFQTELNSSVNRCLLALTEAPNYNIKQWATKTYQHDDIIGPVKKMIQTGYHHANVWFGIIFQILITLQVMYLKKFTFIDMELEDNIFIKDLMNNEQAIGYWKYIFEGLEFYIPNHGFLVMIDSNYKDVKNNHSTFASIKKTKDNELFKMYGEAVDEDFDYSNNDVITEDGRNLDLIQYNNICKILDPTNFGNSHTNYGGIKPDIKVINLLTKIHTKIKSRADNDKNGNLSDIIINYMGMFVNNRTGTQISTSELENVENQPVNDLIKGQMYAYRIRDQLFVWVIFLNNVDSNNCNVLTRNNYKDTDEIIEKRINRMELFEYSSLTNPEQKYKPQEAKLSEDELLEIYYVN